MDCSKTGNLISSIRKEKGMTQKAVAALLGVSVQAVSKWERGLGCPDVTLVSGLADILQISTEALLSGDLPANQADGGNMKKIKFYVCRECGNVITANANAEISCCGKKLSPLDAVKEEEQHKLDVEVVDEEYSVSRKSHPMEKEHYLSFIAYVTSDKLNVCRLYPEQGNEVRFRRSGHGMLYAYCSLEGLFVQRI